MRNIRIATRASRLALVQAEYIRDLLRKLCSDADISIVKISTKGDRDKSDFLYKTGTVGFFTSEVERAILDGGAEMAVHSFKDLPTAITPGLIVAAIPKRENPCDALVASSRADSIEALPPEATVGTSSLRRIAQLKHIRNDLKCVPLRGNVETRVRKVAAGEIDAAVIACAGLNRLGLTDKISAILPLEQFIPAPAQGALAVQIRSDDSELTELVSGIDDNDSRIAAGAERGVLAALHGGCSIPLGVHSQIRGNSITVNAVLSDLDGDKYIKRSATALIDNAQFCARKLAEDLLIAGGKEILEQIRINPADENKQA